MRALHLCFWLHQPYELLGSGKWEKGYFGGANEFKKIDKRDYQPFFALLERNTQRYAKFRVSLVISGVWLEQVERWDKDLLERLQKLVAKGSVELVAAPYYFSMAAFYDLDELKSQLDRIQEKFEQLFGQKSIALALPELCFQNRLARWAEKLGYRVMLAGDASQTLDWRTSNRVYDVKGCENFRVLLANRKLSEMIAEAQDAVTVQVAEELKLDQLDSGRSERKVTTAADFVQALSRATNDKTIAEENSITTKVTYKTEFSAKKLQKQLDLEFLRGDIVTLHLQPKIFSKWRELGIIGCFDELFKLWLEMPGSFLVGVKEALGLEPAAEISVKKTVTRLGETEKSYQLPGWWTVDRAKLAQALYGLRGKILASEDEELYRDFATLTALDYADGGEQYEEILHDINERLSRLVVETADGGEQVVPKGVSESTRVKVNFKTRPKAEDVKTPDEKVYEQFKEAAGIEDGAETIWEADDVDDMEAAIQVMAQRMKRQSESSERDFSNLAEAELVTGSEEIDFAEVEFDLADDEAEILNDLRAEAEIQDEPKSANSKRVKTAKHSKAKTAKKKTFKKIVID